MFRKSRTIDKIKRSYADRVEYVGQTRRVRLVPGDFTPLSAGLICSVAVSAIGCLGCHVAIMWLEWPNPGWLTKGAVAVAFGVAAGTYDYLFTRNGNDLSLIHI